jgi:hypothetical protein
VRSIISTVILFLIPVAAFGQTTPSTVVAHQSNLWLQGFSTIRFDKHWSVPLEAQVRRAHTGLTWQILLLRATLMRDINEHVAVGGGYGHQTTHPAGPFAQPATFGEHRTFEQLVLKNNWGAKHVEQRLRLEQRWIQRVDAVNRVALDEYFFQNRIRYRAGMTIPLPFEEKLKPARGEAETFLFLNDEVAFNFGRNVRQNAFDQNRLAAGIGQKLGKAILQGGYLHQYIRRAGGTESKAITSSLSV